jgi:hypothetical protein
VFGVFAEQDGHQRRLAGAVSTDDAHFLGVADREGDGVQDASGTDLYA